MKILTHKFEEIISIKNLLLAWQEFIKGKRNKEDVQIFQFNLMDNILQLHQDLKGKAYKHGSYHQFKINDPKPRIIHKASVRDRLLHHAVYRILYPYFDKRFIADSYSCRNNKGTHKALNKFTKFANKVSKNGTKQCYILKCDIKKFFASVDQEILVKILKKHICHSRARLPARQEGGNLQRGFRVVARNDTVDLLKEIIFSFKPNGLPLGNLTSQLFANVYMNEFDQFVKHKLKVKYYVRYADDFVVFSGDKKYLENLVLLFQSFLEHELKLKIHPDKIFIKTLCSGVDFLGWVNFKDHRVLRTQTKRRMFMKINNNPNAGALNSYLGLVKHGNSCKIKKKILEKII